MEANGSSWNTRKCDRTDHLQSKSYGELRRSSSLIGRLSCSLLGESHTQLYQGLEDATENGVVSSLVRRSHSLENAKNNNGAYSPLDECVANDIVPERSLSSKGSQGGHSTENSVVFPMPEELLESCGFFKPDPSNSLKNCLISPLTQDTKASLPICGSLLKGQDDKKEQQPVLEYVASLVHLAVFGILGVCSRYLLEKLFGPNMLGLTRDQEILYLDLPSNVVGSFLMGWFGVVFKSDLSHISDQLAIGLSTGYLGSLTTFSSWNQNIVELTVNGQWASAVSSVVIGLFLCGYSISLGVETAKGFKKWLEMTGNDSTNISIRSKKQQLIFLLFLLLVWGGLLETSGVLAIGEFEKGGSAAQLWVGCLVAPIGVWIRWWLASLNGRGIGKAERYKWIPFGTLIANVLAACVTAALATWKKSANTKQGEMIASGVQFGLMGCLSTVSTFMAEFDAMRNSSRTRRAHSYVAITFGFSFFLPTFIYSLPVWTQGYK